MLLDSGHELLGHNLFAYCNNNAVNMVDSDGYFCIPTTPQEYWYLMTKDIRDGWNNIFDSKLSNDIKNFRFNNDSEQVVLNSNYFSFYKGSPVVRHSIPNQTSCGIFGMIILNSNENDPITVKHEWGHNVQERILGTPLYSLYVAAPSVYYNKTADYKNYNRTTRERMYYSKIWERSADWFGGVNRNNYDPFWSTSNFVPW